MEIVSLQRNNPDMLLLSPLFFDLVLVMIAVIMVMVIRMMLVIMVIETTMMLASYIAKVIQPGWREKKTWGPVAGLSLPIRKPGLQQVY